MCPKVSAEYKEAAKRRILEAARRVFAREGYHGASMDGVVRESGLSKGAIYGYFDSKEELFLGVEELVQTPTSAEFLSAVQAADTATERLLKTGELVFQNRAHLDRDTLRVMYEFWTEAPRLRAVERVYLTRFRGTHRFLASLIRDGIRRGEFRGDVDAEALASILMATIDGLCLYWATLGIGLDWKVVEQTFFSVVLNGIRVESGRPVRRNPRGRAPARPG